MSPPTMSFVGIPSYPSAQTNFLLSSSSSSRTPSPPSRKRSPPSNDVDSMVGRDVSTFDDTCSSTTNESASPSRNDCGAGLPATTSPPPTSYSHSSPSNSEHSSASSSSVVAFSNESATPLASEAHSSLKRLRLSSESSGSSGSLAGSRPASTEMVRAEEGSDDRKRRFLKTADVLRRSGLLNITLRTADLIKANAALEEEIRDLKTQVDRLVSSVVSPAAGEDPVLTSRPKKISGARMSDVKDSRSVFSADSGMGNSVSSEDFFS